MVQGNGSETEAAYSSNHVHTENCKLHWVNLGTHLEKRTESRVLVRKDAHKANSSRPRIGTKISFRKGRKGAVKHI